MGYTKLNLASIRKKALSSDKVKKQITTKAEKVVNQEKQKLIEAFSNSSVTQEIAAGPTANNASRTLGGYGNLFSFIGFQSGTDPISPIKNLLQNIGISKVKFNQDKYEITVKYPSQEEIKTVSPLPFETGRSWVEGIESGISGFTQYIYKKFLQGRSKEGVQNDKMNRGGNFQKTPYLFSMLRTFSKNIKGDKNDYSV
jgi:hypothetical protein